MLQSQKHHYVYPSHFFPAHMNFLQSELLLLPHELAFTGRASNASPPASNPLPIPHALQRRVHDALGPALGELGIQEIAPPHLGLLALQDGGQVGDAVGLLVAELPAPGLERQRAAVGVARHVVRPGELVQLAELAQRLHGAQAVGRRRQRDLAEGPPEVFAERGRHRLLAIVGQLLQRGVVLIWAGCVSGLFGC